MCVCQHSLSVFIVMCLLHIKTTTVTTTTNNNNNNNHTNHTNHTNHNNHNTNMMFSVLRHRVGVDHLQVHKAWIRSSSSSCSSSSSSSSSTGSNNTSSKHTNHNNSNSSPRPPPGAQGCSARGRAARSRCPGTTQTYPTPTTPC